MSRVTLQGYIIITDDDLASVQAVLPEHIKLTQKEQGCLVFRVSQDAENKNRFNVYEEFVNRAAFVTHQERVKHSRWGQVATNVERHYELNSSDLNEYVR